MTSYGRNKNRDDEIKNQEKAKNSPSYLCAAIKQNIDKIFTKIHDIRQKVCKNLKEANITQKRGKYYKHIWSLLI